MWTLGMLASHRGSNVQAVVRACEQGRVRARPALVISNNAKAEVLDFAREHGVSARWIGGKSFADDEVRDEAILAALREHDVDLVLSLGYLKKLGPRTLSAYRGRVLNIHPALLPRYGGRGMYGMHVHRAVLEAGDTQTGVTIHVMDEAYDHGPIVAQTPVPVHAGDTPEQLAARVLEREHEFLVETLQRIADGELPLERGAE